MEDRGKHCVIVTIMWLRLIYCGSNSPHLATKCLNCAHLGGKDSRQVRAVYHCLPGCHYLYQYMWRQTGCGAYIYGVLCVVYIYIYHTYIVKCVCYIYVCMCVRVCVWKTMVDCVMVIYGGLHIMDEWLIVCGVCMV